MNGTGANMMSSHFCSLSTSSAELTGVPLASLTLSVPFPPPASSDLVASHRSGPCFLVSFLALLNRG